MTDPVKPSPETLDPVPFDEVEYRRRQRVRANAMAVMLAALAVLFFFITIAKMTIFQ